MRTPEENFMELLQLWYFLQLAKTQHVSKTADMLYISQPSLSATIKKLESELNVPLFIRKGRSIELSKYGTAYKKYVEDVFLALENGKTVLDKMRDADNSELTLGLLSPYVWMEVFQKFHALHPEIKINRFSIETFDFTDILVDGKVDMYIGGINGIEQLDQGNIQYKTLYEDDMVLLVNKSHPLAGKKSIDLRQCCDEHFINLDQNTSLGQFISFLYKKSGFDPNVIMVCDYTLRDKMVSDNHGVSITTKRAAMQTDEKDVTYVPISYPSDKRKLGFVWRKNRIFSKSMKAFYDFAFDFYKKI